MVKALDGGFVCMLGNYFRSRLGKGVFGKGGGMHPRILYMGKKRGEGNRNSLRLPRKRGKRISPKKNQLC